MATKSQRITLGGGCFWCIEAVFSNVEGVESAVSGYAGGTVEDPSYEDVCTGRTGHAEVVQVTFDPDVIPLRDVLGIFFTVHDPTQLNRQGPDTGTQYRSAVFYENDEQQKAAQAAIKDLASQGLWDDPVVTQIQPLEKFWPAEDYHQNYYEQNKMQPYCFGVIRPKIAKFRKKWAGRLRVEA